ncbi:hypothetical protein FRC01_002789 [Tulasnella sp. 417]|nr:hypothetical protein FRC01_002789 [Tulasnella sp. 417]
MVPPSPPKAMIMRKRRAVSLPLNLTSSCRLGNVWPSQYPQDEGVLAMRLATGSPAITYVSHHNAASSIAHLRLAIRLKLNDLDLTALQLIPYATVAEICGGITKLDPRRPHNPLSQVRFWWWMINSVYHPNSTREIKRAPIVHLFLLPPLTVVL